MIAKLASYFQKGGNLLLKNVVGLNLLPGETSQTFYADDGLWTLHNHDFMQDEKYRNAYERGVQACSNNRMYWRVHTALWAASVAQHVAGDFVECGVNRGFVSSAVMTYLDWNRLTKSFYLLDTFGGIDARFVTEEEKAGGVLTKNDRVLAMGGYATDVEAVRANFQEWDRVHIIQGTVPETLEQVPAEQIAYLHIDMNNATPEAAATDYFWPKMSPGGVILYDDYAYVGYTPQKKAIDALAAKYNVPVLSLPTGQGILIKPCI
ncbi:TylF/MycF family methyltransferase [Blastopirellula sp. JC732]|uniref:TylF/MycF family methyltransferase n=1 Tax=Blastopirellula sediminis TaxID=2894196 RepID=A0A9X1MM66_9BACT|nr:TylF/MycF/NovP-related O-methyltransferase [Blastopirellula sediminis]MCC9608438.1 TylF/MycF family methyltransferase [Blastopirellula sediminis]MCC9628785.1 TylF/MycF family methyltransferase [Blastopirellula sediminis]